MRKLAFPCCLIVGLTVASIALAQNSNKNVNRSRDTVDRIRQTDPTQVQRSTDTAKSRAEREERKRRERESHRTLQIREPPSPHHRHHRRHHRHRRP